MLTFSDTLSEIAALLLPRRCPVCHGEMLPEERFVCTSCRFDIPLTGFAANPTNPMIQRFWGIVPVERAAALFWFREGSAWRDAVHRFKYGGRWILARRLGEWLGSELLSGEGYADVELVVPVPLHWRKRLARGYNQSEYIAEGVAATLGSRCDFRALKRTRNNPSQALGHRLDRWENVEGIFAVRDAKRLRGRHILLVDDVFTSGATVTSCAEAIVEACGGDVRISVATVAVSSGLEKV